MCVCVTDYSLHLTLVSCVNRSLSIGSQEQPERSARPELLQFSVIHNGSSFCLLLSFLCLISYVSHDMFDKAPMADVKRVDPVTVVPLFHPSLRLPSEDGNGCGFVFVVGDRSWIRRRHVTTP